MEIESLVGTKIIQIDTSMNHSIAVSEDGTVYTWGSNTDGQLGNGSRRSSSVPVKTFGMTMVRIIQAASGTGSSAAIADNGTVYAWGLNDDGQLGSGTRARSLVPARVAALERTHVSQIDAAVNHMVAVSEDGTAYSWGRNSFGQLGTRTTTGSLSPVSITIPAGVNFKRVILGDAVDLGYAIDEQNVVDGWGNNISGLIDPTTTADVLAPTKTGVLPPVVQSVSFGGTDAPDFSQNGFSLRVTSPPHTSGISDIIVFYSDGTSNTFNGAFSYGSAPEVRAHPQSITADQQFLDSGAPAIFTAEASGDEAPTVTWQSSTNEGTTWSDVIAATTDTLSIPSTDLVDGTWYRAEFTNPLGQIVTDHAELTVTGTLGPAPARVSMVKTRVGGGKTTGWGIDAMNADSSLNFDRGDGATTGEVTPSSYALTVVLPSGISLSALERLDLSVPACAAAAEDSTSAQQSCWIKTTAADQQNFVVDAGSHQVLRLSGASPADMPPLPLTGGVGTYVFVMVAAGLVAVAAAVYPNAIRKRKSRLNCRGGGGAP